jgi:hypothetical protein
MKRLLLSFIVGLSILWSFQDIGAETIKIGYFPHKPHQYQTESSGKPRGATVTYFEAVAAKMGYEVEWVGPLPINRLIDYLKEGRVDGGAHLAVLSSELLKKLEYAAITTNVVQLTALIGGFQAQHPSLANALMQMVDNFEYPALSALIQATLKAS